MASEVFTVYTFGDSILDCARYNEYGVHPGQLIVRNDDGLFPDFKGRDLSSSAPARLDHRARDGATVDDLPRQGRVLDLSGPAAALVTISGNDLLTGLAADRGGGMVRFERALDTFLCARRAPGPAWNSLRSTFGDDSRNFLSIDAHCPAQSEPHQCHYRGAGCATWPARRCASSLSGRRPIWFTRTIEPSLRGASEVRAAFLPAVLKAREVQPGAARAALRRDARGGGCGE